MRWFGHLVLSLMTGVAGGALNLAAEGPVVHARALEAAARAWDLEAAMAILARIRAQRSEQPTPPVAELQVRAGTLVVELLRLEFELADGSERELRRQLGERIDAVAQEALALLAGLTESSERARLEADLVAAMIRSDYRARRFESRLRAAIERARELDPANPHAVVSAAKPLVFAPPGKGQDLAAALHLLDRALELEPGLEAAHLLRAEALERSGDSAAAADAWQRALEANPSCRPARLRLGR